MSKIEVNTVAPQCGTTLTLGESGDTVTLGSGASQSGFGRTGTVDWQVSDIKTGDFTAVSGEGYFINTTSGTITMTLPSSPSAGDIVSVKDYANTFDTNALTIGTSDTTLLAGGNYDAVIGIRCCNILTSTIAIDVKIAKGGADYFLAKGVNIPPNSAIELIQGGAKIVLASGDTLEAVSDTASSLDVVLSYIDTISS